jgi:uncharacterized ferredoxin-like protein
MVGCDPHTIAWVEKEFVQRKCIEMEEIEERSMLHFIVEKEQSLRNDWRSKCHFLSLYASFRKSAR